MNIKAKCSLVDKTVIVTGGNRGLGLETARALAVDNNWQSPRYVDAYALAYPERDPLPEETVLPLNSPD